MDIKTLKSNIERLEKSIGSPATPEKLKPQMEAKVKELKAKLEELEAEEEEEEEDEPAGDGKTPTTKEPKKAKKKDAEPKAPVRRKLTKEDRATCDELMKEVRSLLNKYQGAKKPKAKNRTTKRVSTVVAERIVASVATAVNKEMTADKVGKIKPDKLRDVRDHMEKALKSLRQALGGISDENDNFIVQFKSHFNELIDKVEEKQKKV